MEKTRSEVQEAVTLAKMTNEAVDLLETRVDKNDAKMRTALAETEARISDKMEGQVKVGWLVGWLYISILLVQHTTI